ncbi:MAG: CPBP family intramembrane metalloprotease [bacterium]|jgi:uncharacterized protein
MHVLRKFASSIYFLLTVLLSWGLVIILAGPNNLPIDPERSADLLPVLYISMLLGPSAAGLLMTGLTEGKRGFTELRARLMKWRAGIHWYAFALFAPPVAAILILLLLSLFSSQFQPSIQLSDQGSRMIMNGVLAGIMVGLFEEIGWTGFLIPRMLQRHTLRTTGLTVGVLWGAWHFILFWESDSFYAGLPFLVLLGRLFAWLPPFRVIMVWIYDQTDSLPLVILTHASLVFTTTVLVPMTLSGTLLLAWILTWGVILWIAGLILTHSKRERKNKI